jgi:hypothetical protein
MITTNRTIYKNTARYDVLNYVQSFQPTPLESLYLDKILVKNSLSMRDLKTFLEYFARRNTKTLVNSEQLEALGLPILPMSVDTEVS